MYIYFVTLENNYMFRLLIMAIFRLYMNHLVGSYTNIYIYGLLIWGTGGVGGGVKCARDLVSVRTVGTCVLHGGLMLLSSYV